MENVLEIKGLSKKYSSVQAVENLHLQIPKGSVFGLLGPNGSGKTTTLGMVLGVIKPQSGEFKWFGGALNFSAKRRMGAILETPNFYPYMSGLQNLQMVATIKELKDPPLQEILQTVNLHGRAKSKFKTYSLGMKQRLAIASALLSDPEVLILDEPTNGLDPQGIVEIRAIINKIAQRGITVIIASHLLDEVEKVCTHAAVLKQGKLLFSGTVEELTGHEGVVEISSENNKALMEVLSAIPAIDSIKEENGILLVMLHQPMNAAEINRQLSLQGIFVNHLVFRKNSLEKQFINLIRA